LAKGLQSIIVVVDMPRGAPAIATRAAQIATGVDNHATYFPSPDPPVAKVNADIAALVRENGLIPQGLSTADRRNVLTKAVLADVKKYHAMVQSAAQDDPEHADLIASGATMRLRVTPQRHKPALELRQRVSGEVTAIAKRVAGAQAYLWAYSLDGGITWKALDGTTRAQITVTGLTPGTVVWFRFRVLTRQGRSDWLATIPHLVT
jgi:hypothetical protein